MCFYQSVSLLPVLWHGLRQKNQDYRWNLMLNPQAGLFVHWMIRCFWQTGESLLKPGNYSEILLHPVLAVRGLCTSSARAGLSTAGTVGTKNWPGYFRIIRDLEKHH